jgi:hypothetical protein
MRMHHRTDKGNPFAEMGARAPAWGGLDDILPGDVSAEEAQLSAAQAQAQAQGRAESKAVTLVVFVGGVTYSEISVSRVVCTVPMAGGGQRSQYACLHMQALRFMAKNDPERQYVVAATSIMNGDSLLGELTEEVVGLHPDRSNWTSS